MTRDSLCSYSLHQTVEAGKMDAFGYNRFCKEAGLTQLDPWNAHIAQAYDDNGYVAELKASGADLALPCGCIAVDGAQLYEPGADARAENHWGPPNHPDARLPHFKTFAFDADGNEPNWDIPDLIHMLQNAGYQGAWGIESTPDDGDEIGAAKKTLALLKRILEY